MILTAHQPVYLPWLGLFHKIAVSDVFCSFDDVQYLKKDWNSRNRIMTSSGPIWLSVPVLSGGHREKAIREIEIDNSTDWRRKHWKSIYLNYKKAPHFHRYAGFLEEAYKRDWTHLTPLNEHMLQWFLKELGIETRFHKASESGFEGRKSDLVLDMCRTLRAGVDGFGIHGKEYAEVEKFERAGIQAYFQDYKHPVYPQAGGGFVPYLSVIDLLFNCGPESLAILMSVNAAKAELRSLEERK